MHRCSRYRRFISICAKTLTNSIKLYNFTPHAHNNKLKLIERNDSGFGIVTVMAGAVVLGIFALVYVQSAQNRANFSQITTLMSFREQVMTYYSSVVANRGTWECTVKANYDLRRYLASGTAATSSNALEIRDYTGNCQEKLALSPSSGDLLIATAGLGLNLQDYNDLPVTPPRPCDNTESGTEFCLKVEWERHAIATGRRGVVVKLKLDANRKAIKQKSDVNFELTDKEHTLYMTRTVATDCSDGRVTGYFPGRVTGQVRGFDGYIETSTSPHPVGSGVAAYAGDAAVVAFDALTGLVQCSTLGPLVVPPCYNVTDTSELRGKRTNPFLSGSGMVGWSGFVNSSEGFGGIPGGGVGLSLQCDGRGRSPRAPIQGSCPRTSGSGTTAIAYFDPQTGIAQCSHPNILVEKVDTTRGSDYIKRHYCDGDNRFGIVQIGSTGTFACSTSIWGTNRGGVQPTACGANQAISGFNNRGERSCISGGTPAMRGFSGPQGERGMSGRDRYNQHNSTRSVRTGYDSRGRSKWATYPSGPGVGPRGPLGERVPCDTSRDRSPHSSCYRSWRPCS